MLRSVGRWLRSRCGAGARYVVRVWREGSAALAEAVGGDGRTRGGAAMAIGTTAFLASAWKGVAIDRTWTSATRLVPPLVVIAAVTASVQRTPPPRRTARLRASGLLPLAPVAVDRRQLARLLLGLVAAALAVWAAMPVERGHRAVLVAGSVAALGGLVWWEARQTTPPPDRAVLWAVAPLVAAATCAALLLLIRDDQGELTRSALVELLLATALTEELLFRGAILPAAYQVVASPLAAEVFTAVLFGCWHVGNSIGGTGGSALWWRAVHLLGTVAFTTLGGLLFSWMRHRTRSLLGPVLTHAATNLPGIAA